MKVIKFFSTLLFLFYLLIPFTFAEYRFPKPEFSSNYTQPVPAETAPDIASSPLPALILLVIVLILTIFTLYKKRSRFWLRILIVASVSYFGFYHGGCICSIGSIQNVAQSLFNEDSFISGIVLTVFFLPLFTALFFGRIFCAAACPLGAIQELVIIRPLKVPYIIDRILKLIPYIYLGLAVLFAANNMGYIICKYDPFVGFFRFSAPLPLIISGVLLLLTGTIIARPYCRYICPYSVLLRITAKFSARKVSVTPAECIVCHLCNDACPVGAITPPKPQKFPESKEQSLSRMHWIAALTPFLIILGILAGLALYKPLAKQHPEISLIRELHGLKNKVIKERDIYNRDISNAEAFLEKGGDTEQLKNDALKAKRKLKKASVIFGIYLMLIFIAALIKALKRRNNQEYTVESSECIACARCYQYCPVQKKIKG